MHEEKRRHKRWRTNVFFGVYDCETEAFVGRISDITTEGVMLTCEKQIEAGVRRRLRIDLPVEIYGANTVDFEAKCLWCRPAPKEGFHQAGFKLTEVSSKNVDVIRQLVQASQLDQAAPCPSVRFAQPAQE
ncbi:MAG: PilZ domain-containing protein [candidate division Zixibacteria bacterium]|nr:PilZ domain-containing protein [candidate division Zixibacteria bacterium]